MEDLSVSAWRLSWLDGTEREVKEEERREQLWNPRIDVRWGVQLCTGCWLNSRFVRHSSRQKHQRRIVIKGEPAQEESTIRLHGHRSFPYFSYSTRSLYTDVHLSVRIFFLSFSLSGFLIAQFHSTFFPFLFFDSSQIENEPEWFWMKSQILSRSFLFTRSPPISLVSRPSSLRSQFAFLYTVQVYSKKKKEEEKRKKKRRGEPAASSAWAFPSFLSSSLSFISSNVLALLEMCWF